MARFVYHIQGYSLACVLLSSLLYLCSASSPLSAEEFQYSYEDNVQNYLREEVRQQTPDTSGSWLDSIRDQLRFAFDLSSRTIYNEGADRFSYQNFAGFDIYKVLSNNNGDIGVLLLQGYLTRNDDLPGAPGFFEGEDDWEFVPRIFNFNYTGLYKGRINFKIGHFEVPYGLELPINTNGTLRDIIHGRNLGVKPDWGVTVNGVLPDFEYEIGLSRGTGIEYTNTGNPHIIAGRIGTPAENNLIFGLSGFYGEVRNGKAAGLFRSGIASPETDARGTDGIIQRSRIGADVQWYYRQIGILAESSIGRDYDQDIFTNFVELNWTNLDETWFVYAQLLNFNQDFSDGWERSYKTRVGFDYRPDNNWSISTEVTSCIENFRGGDRKHIIRTQLRYRFELL